MLTPTWLLETVTDHTHSSTSSRAGVWAGCISMLILYADGGCFPNPGNGTFGVVAKVGDVVLARISERIGHATNNIAEWRGAIAALQYAIDTRAMAVELRMDSRLVVEQVNGRWKVENAGLKPLAEQGKALLAELRRRGVAVNVKWVPREQNTEADELT